ncbi:MAG: 50S ribosomal protein L23 [Candidatus Doudnabacteria bacterium]|nr:50S ribosomal protein L23 [Candidatus Doudnabacteria bacterium]
MGILDKLGIKKRQEEKPVLPPADKVLPKEVPQTEARSARPAATGAHRLLARPILSEKGTALANSGRYVFAVALGANKPEIKKSIENIYNVTVESVRIVNLPAKTRRYGRTVGKTSAWKKAIITLKAGERIPGIVESVG